MREFVERQIVILWTDGEQEESSMCLKSGGFDNFTRNERDWVHRPYSGELVTASL